MNRRLFISFAILSLLVSTTGPVQAQPPALATGIRVQAYGIHYGGNIVYHYKVINSSDAPFNNFTIGSYYDSENDSEYPQLTRLPLGWTYGEEGETGPAIILAQVSTSQPAYWTSNVFGQQGTGNYYLKWLASRGPGDVSNAIRPGQTLGGFSVTVPLADDELSLPAIAGQPVFTGPDNMYVRGGFRIGYRSGNKYQEVWGTLEPLDTTPPSLMVSISPDTPWPPNDKLVPVTATITVNDDYDPAPEVQLVSIMANEVLDINDARDIQPGTDDRQFQLKAKRAEANQPGRIYTITYSATDGSGNKATASANVTVPHDQGK